MWTATSDLASEAVFFFLYSWGSSAAMMYHSLSQMSETCHVAELLKSILGLPDDKHNVSITEHRFRSVTSSFSSTCNSDWLTGHRTRNTMEAWGGGVKMYTKCLYTNKPLFSWRNSLTGSHSDPCTPPIIDTKAGPFRYSKNPPPPILIVSALQELEMIIDLWMSF